MRTSRARATLAYGCDYNATVRRDLIVRWTYSTQKRIGVSEQPVRYEEEGRGMSSYANYCQDQATDCARRARLASSPEIVAYCRSLCLRWLARAGILRWTSRPTRRGRSNDTTSMSLS